MKSVLSARYFATVVNSRDYNTNYAISWMVVNDVQEFIIVV
ncbi:hypothetical protein [Pedobacter heparinus]|nr:hypothetical protein [Pedobacter heparinus]